MAQLPRGLVEAAQLSIEVYQAQITLAEMILDSPQAEDASLAIVELRRDRTVRRMYALGESEIEEALQLLIAKKKESITVLRDCMRPLE